MDEICNHITIEGHLDSDWTCSSFDRKNTIGSCMLVIGNIVFEK